MARLLVGLASPAPQCGKTTAANFLAERFGFSVVGIGDLVKSEVAEMLQVYGLSYDEDRKSEFRPLLTSWAILRMTLCGEGYWNERLLGVLETTSSERIAIPDLRTPEEMEIVAALGGVTMEIMRDSVEVSRDPLEGLLANSKFDFRVDNSAHDGGANMFAQLVCVMEHLRVSG